MHWRSGKLWGHIFESLQLAQKFVELTPTFSQLIAKSREANLSSSHALAKREAMGALLANGL